MSSAPAAEPSDRATVEQESLSVLEWPAVCRQVAAFPELRRSALQIVVLGLQLGQTQVTSLSRFPSLQVSCTTRLEGRLRRVVCFAQLCTCQLFMQASLDQLEAENSSPLPASPYLSPHTLLV